jgi:ABC-type phosphate transport system substrate-binding protein
MAFAQELKRTVVMGALLAVAVGAIGAQAQPANPPTPPQSGAPELLLSSLVAPVVVSVVAFFASFAL